jgi:hypothetical protein
MKDIATFVGDSGKTMAVIYRGDGFYKVNYGTSDDPSAYSKMFMNESDASAFAAEYTNKGSKPRLLSE